MLELYGPVVVIAAVVAAFISGARLAYVMGKKWEFEKTPLGWLCFASGAASAVVIGVLCAGAVENYGLLAGLISAFAGVPLAGFTWLFIVGINKAVERILGRLDSKLSS